MKLETLLDYFIFFIIIIKLVFSITYFGHIILTYTNTGLTELFDKVSYIGKKLLNLFSAFACLFY